MSRSTDDLFRPDGNLGFPASPQAKPEHASKGSELFSLHSRDSRASEPERNQKPAWGDRQRRRCV